MNKWLLGLVILVVSALPAKAQTITAGPYLCVDQTSFFCSGAPSTGMKATWTVNGVAIPGTMAIDIFSGGTGYVSFTASDGSAYFDGSVMSVTINTKTDGTQHAANSAYSYLVLPYGLPLTESVTFSSVECYTPAGSCAISGELNLTNVWYVRSSGMGRGGHSWIWLPDVTATGSFVSD